MTRTVPRTASPSRAAGLNPFLKPIARLFNRPAALLAGRRILPVWALLRHRGRRSGRMYATPVAARRTPDGFAIPLPWGAETDWCRNVLADGSCEIRWSGINYATDSPIVVDAERALSALRPIERRIARAVGIHRFLLVRARGT